MNTHDGKSVKFGKPKISGKKACNYHFEIHHYAGTVGYNIDSWLDKNKDPINEAVAGIFAKSGDPFIAHLWKDYASEGVIIKSVETELLYLSRILPQTMNITIFSICQHWNILKPHIEL